MFKSELSENLAKWELDYSKLSKDDIEVLTIINFPKKLGYYNAAQMRVKRMYANGGFIDKPQVTINDITFTVTSKKNAQWFVDMHTPAANATARDLQHLEGVLKSKSKQFVYFDGNSMDQLLELILNKFSVPKPTPSAVVEETIKEEKPKAKKASRKYVLSDKEKGQIEDMAFNKSMDLKEMSTELGVPQTVIKEHLKTLKNA